MTVTRPLTKKDEALKALRKLNVDERFEVFAELLRTPNRSCATVDTTPFRERYLVLQAREHPSAEAIAERLGWLRPTRQGGGQLIGDSARLRRCLGLQATSSGSGTYTVGRFVSYETAVALCDALGLDYTEADV